MCEVTVNNYEGHVMSGDVSHPAVEDRRAFYNEFELREKIAEMIDPLPEQEKEPAVIISRSFRVENGNYSPATFVVLLMHEAVARSGQWEKEPVKKTHTA